MASTAAAIVDPYAEKVSFWKTHTTEVWAVGVFITTVLLTVFSFPPYSKAEFAYAFAAPAIFWAYLKPSFKLYAWTLFAAQAVSWTLILSWLHYVTWLGLFLLGPFVGVWVGVWYLAVWWTMPRLIGCESRVRIFAMFGLAALWVVLEWTRNWGLSGFPWLPLAATQWQRTVVLQIASVTGSAGVSFLLIVFNIGFAAYGHRLIKERQQGLRKRSPEFMVALILLMFPCYYLLITETSKQDRQPFLRVAVVQPAIPQAVKWDPSQSDFVFNTLGGLTAKAAATRPDLMLWPEAATPFAVKGDFRVQQWTEKLVQRCNVPLLMGSISVTSQGGENEVWQNGAFVIDPASGLQPGSYAKRHLVPFGEYVPIRPLLGWLNKIVPVGDGDYTPGSTSTPLVIPTASGVFEVGPLICYEDIFPELARESVNDGAELLVVMTNDAWYGTGGAAYQHAANAVLRAVELRRPMVRCGNDGWSGWIDEFGSIRSVMTSEKHGVYFQGTKTFTLTRDAHWIGRQSFYAEHGEWFIGVCGILILFGAWVIKTSHPLVTADGEASEDAPF